MLSRRVFPMWHTRGAYTSFRRRHLLALLLLWSLSTYADESSSGVITRPRSDGAPGHEFVKAVTVNGEDDEFIFLCSSHSQEAAKSFCSSRGIQDDSCILSLTSLVRQETATSCPQTLEQWHNQSLKDYMEALQWKILEFGDYMGVQMWKFPVDLNVYRQLIFKERPDVLIEIGNNRGGSTLWLAHLLDIMNHGRIIAVDIDHSIFDQNVRLHPRITLIEGDAPAVFEKVQQLINPKHERVLVIEDASHRYQATLDIMNSYGTLVNEGSWMIIEDTILHHGAENLLFTDPGAHKSVEDFMNDPTHRQDWRIVREMEKFIMTWNPSGFLQKIQHPARKTDTGELVFDRETRQGLYNYHHQWHRAGMDHGRFLSQLDQTKSYKLSAVSLSGPGGTDFLFSPSLEGHLVDVQTLYRDIKTLCQNVLKSGSEDLCISLVMAKVFSTHPGFSSASSPSSWVPMHDWEVDTPLHVYVNRSTFNVVHRPRIMPPVGSAARAVRNVGVAVVGPILDKTAVDRLRRVVSSRPEFVERTPNVPHRSRYFDPLCGGKSNRCQAWDPGFVSLVEHPYVLKEVEALVGSDCIVDSTAMSVQWPGESAFGPHVDRPLVEKDDDSVWPYSSVDYPSPPLDHPISIQVLWLLDNFTTSNGAFYVLNEGFEKNNEGKRPNMAQGIYPTDATPQMVTGLEGSVIIAQGSAWHGAAHNFYPRPRIAFLVQYVPKFVRPGSRYPFSMLPHGASYRLKSLFDVHRHEVEESMELTFEGRKSETFQYNKNSLSGVYENAFELATNAFQLQPEEAHVTAMSVEDEALKRALLEYDICHPPKSSSPSVKPTPRLEETSPRSYVLSNLHHNMVDFTVPPLAFGVGGITAGMSESELVELVLHALKSGIRHLDLAEMYGNQKAIGKLFFELWGSPGNMNSGVPSGHYAGLPRREDVFITSKVWCTNMSPEHVQDALLLTLEHLQLSYLDLWLIHWPVPLEYVGLTGPSLKGIAYPKDPNTGAVKFAAGFSLCDTWRAMERSSQEGLARNLGVSNFPRALLHDIISCHRLVRPLVNQVEAHPFLPQTNLINFARAHNVTVQAYSPLGGFVNSNERALFTDPTLGTIANDHEKSVAEILLRWSYQRGVPVVSTSRKMRRVEQFARVGLDFKLTNEDMKKINSIGTRIRFMVPPPFSFLFGD